MSLTQLFSVCIAFALVTIRSGSAQSIAVSPSSITLDGTTGTRVDRVVTVHNLTSSPRTVTLAESTVTSNNGVVGNAPQSLSFQPFIEKLRVQDLPVRSRTEALQPLVFTTAASDTRGDNLLFGVDVLEIQYQKRNIFIVGWVLDIKVTMISRDSLLAGFIHLDTDQDFGTGVWPAPWGFGLPGRDIGSEFEILVDASGIIADSLGLGNLPVAILLRASDTTVVPYPLGLTITRDSLFTLTITGIPFGPLGINDPDQNLNIGAVFARLDPTSAFPDFIPNVGHGLVGTEQGVPWMRQSQTALTIPANDSASVTVSVLAATPPGQHNAVLRFSSAGLSPVHMPVQMNVVGLNAVIGLSTANFVDTVLAGNSAELNLSVTNTGNTELIWLLADTNGTPWLSAAPAFGIVDPGGSSQTTITMNSQGLPPDATYSAEFLVVSNDGTQGTIVFPVSLTVLSSTSVKEAGVPTSIRLYPNYPNPFNPGTTIRFELPEAEHISLQLFDLLGRRVATLAEGRHVRGSHSYTLDARGLPSGVYFCRLLTRTSSESISIVLSK